MSRRNRNRQNQQGGPQTPPKPPQEPIAGASALHDRHLPAFRDMQGQEWRGINPSDLSQDEALLCEKMIGGYNVRYFYIDSPADLAEYARVRAEVVAGRYHSHIWLLHVTYKNRPAHYIEWSDEYFVAPGHRRSEAIVQYGVTS